MALLYLRHRSIRTKGPELAYKFTLIALVSLSGHLSGLMRPFRNGRQPTVTGQYVLLSTSKQGRASTNDNQ